MKHTLQVASNFGFSFKLFAVRPAVECVRTEVPADRVENQRCTFSKVSFDYLLEGVGGFFQETTPWNLYIFPLLFPNNVETRSRSLSYPSETVWIMS